MNNEERKAEFVAWPKIPRSKNNKVTITEKMDGTNACIIIENGVIVGVQSRSRLITPGKDTDNFGFAGWVERNREELLRLGDGYHYGEWVGPGIQKNPHGLDEKTLFLFNTARPSSTLPDCVKQVDVLYHGELFVDTVDDVMCNLKEQADLAGTVAEGVIVYYHATRNRVKFTFNFSEGKWKNG